MVLPTLHFLPPWRPPPAPFLGAPACEWPVVSLPTCPGSPERRRFPCPSWLALASAVCSPLPGAPPCHARFPSHAPAPAPERDGPQGPEGSSADQPVACEAPWAPQDQTVSPATRPGEGGPHCRAIGVPACKGTLSWSSRVLEEA